MQKEPSPNGGGSFCMCRGYSASRTGISIAWLSSS